ncbi:MAG: 30S ribosomal protein S18 [Chloroflexi bacterium]|nr:30S ribosomal protein S18 [Chloroflexota bacterium]MDA1218760.1 30S ribosomal protein S18 [Chloroflexota bacterium]PKB56998.1 MAG: 30S ribosomal protein S18 [SAR202 cluster bacterium Casp-Chloro-G3]
MTTTQEPTPGAPQPRPYSPPQGAGAPRPGGFRPAGSTGYRPSGPGGPRPAGGQRPGPGGVRPRGRYGPRRRVCSFCVEHVKGIDYKDVDRIRRFISDRAKIEPTRKTGVCAKHQRLLSTAIKRARHLALLPFVPNPALGGMGGGYRR